MTPWDRPESRWKRPKETVADHLYWSYAGLIATRIAQKQKRPQDRQGRNRLVVPVFYALRRGDKKIGSLERDLFQSIMSDWNPVGEGSGQ